MRLLESHCRERHEHRIELTETQIDRCHTNSCFCLIRRIDFPLQMLNHFRFDRLLILQPVGLYNIIFT